jgi:hypothetical protein
MKIGAIKRHSSRVLRLAECSSLQSSLRSEFGEQVVIVTRRKRPLRFWIVFARSGKFSVVFIERAIGRKCWVCSSTWRPISGPEMQLYPRTNEILDPFQWPSQMELFQVNGPAGLLDFVWPVSKFPVIPCIRIRSLTRVTLRPFARLIFAESLNSFTSKCHRQRAA